MKVYNYLFFASVLSLLMSMSACQSATGNQTGSEYMPDMAHSVAYEANVYGYYSLNRWGTREELHAMVQPRIPVKGTVARGFLGGLDARNAAHKGIQYTPNASVPYHYVDTEEDRTKAIADIINSPYPITKSGLDKGKLLYNINCAICHGEKGDGAGYLLRDDGGKYPVQPANFLLDEHVNASNGRYYHSIMYGKNLMGGYADKLAYDERWEVIHYIRSLQATSKKLEYSDVSNTLNTVDVPYKMYEARLPKSVPAVMPIDSTMLSDNHTKESHTQHGKTEKH